MEKPHRRWRRRASWPLTSARANGRDEAVLLLREAGMDSFVIFFFYVRERCDTSRPTLSAAGVATLWLRSTAHLVEPVDPLFLC